MPRTRRILIGVLMGLSGSAGSAAGQAPASPPNAAEIERRVETILGQMTLEEKASYVGGVDGFYVRAIPRLGVPRLRMADGPFGVRNYGPATTVAGGIGLAATWDVDLARRVGVELGRDSRARGVHFLLAPGVNIYRAPMNGRNFEYFGEDPFLAARMTVGYIKGVQETGVSATVKHFLGNNSEFDRHHTDSAIDERALREIYLPAFEAAVKEARTGALMTSYNLVNGVHMSQYGRFNSDLLKKEWGFDGVVMSDWVSVYDGLAAANGGLDLEMPSALLMSAETLVDAVRAGTLPLATLDDKVRRILRVAVRFSWLDRDQADLTIPALNPQGRAVALESAREGMVLLRNDGPLLPLDRRTLKTVAVIGSLAHPAAPVGGGSAGVQPYRAVSALEGLTEALGPSVTVFHHRGVPTLNELADRTSFTTDADGKTPGVTLEVFATAEPTGSPAARRVERRMNFTGPFVPASGTGMRAAESSARWTGYFTPAEAGAHRLFVHEYRGEGGCRASLDDASVIDNWEVSRAMLSEASITLAPGPHRVTLECFRRRMPGSTNVSVRLGIVPQNALVEPAARAIAARADVVLAAVGFDTQSEGESGDRAFALPVGQDLLIRELAAANPKTIVAVTSGGGFDVEGWIDRVPALVATWFPGQEGGTALAQLLLGEANFSGRLPVTFERRWADNPNHDFYYPAKGTTRVPYGNGVFVGYRGFEKSKTVPRFPFGYGLSYTRFAYSGLTIVPRRDGQRPSYDVSFEVKNTGAREGADAAQVYVAEKAPAVERPPKELKGFARVALRPGESRRVTVRLDARAFSYYDTASRSWRVNPGQFEILVGPSSAETPLRASVKLD